MDRFILYSVWSDVTSDHASQTENNPSTINYHDFIKKKEKKTNTYEKYKNHENRTRNKEVMIFQKFPKFSENSS